MLDSKRSEKSGRQGFTIDLDVEASRRRRSAGAGPVQDLIETGQLDRVDGSRISGLLVEYLRTHPEAVRVGRSGAGYVSVRVSVLMHRLLMDPPRGMEVDHANGVRSDNRRSNLRLATSSQNRFNMLVRKRAGMSSSRYRGVSLHRSRKGDTTTRWKAVISVLNVTKHLGYYRDEVEAARAYDRAAILHHGRFAKLNFPGSVDRDLEQYLAGRWSEYGKPVESAS